MRILIVDDDQAVRASIADLLRTQGHEAVEAPSGEDGFFEAARLDVDLVVTDVRMPGWTGIDLVNTLQTVLPGIPIVVVSAYLDRNVEAQLKNRPYVKKLIPKPFGREALLGAIAEVRKKPAR